MSLGAQEEPPDVDDRPVAVLGGGTMSPGIAAAFALHGDDVIIWTRRTESAVAAAKTAAAMAMFVVEHGLAAEAGTLAERLQPTSTLDDIAAARVVIEAISEDLEAKQELLAQVEGRCAVEALLVTNTSGLRVTDIARTLERPERFVAMHFWNPAHLMPLVEIAGGERTSAESVARAVELAHMIGKQPVVLRREILGFLGTRMQQAVVREAIALLQAGVASAEDIDQAVRASFGIRFPVLGPLETTDVGGLDVIRSIHEYLLPDLDASTRPQPALLARIDGGDLGVKTGRGFHDWSQRDASELVRARDEELVRRLHLLRAAHVS
jgi:3-hydroxybutyryl-CoA dehydrogenase